MNFMIFYFIYAGVNRTNSIKYGSTQPPIPEEKRSGKTLLLNYNK